MSYDPESEFLSRIREVVAFGFNTVVINNGSRDLGIEDLQGLTIIKSRRNWGACGGARLGMNYFASTAFSYLILFDDDTKFEPAILAETLDTLTTAPTGVGVILAASVARESRPGAGKAFVRRDAGIMSGSIISKALVKAVGCYRSRFFMEGGDIEYCFRALSRGFTNYELSTWRISQRFGMNQQVRFLGRSVTLDNHSPYRHFLRGRALAVLSFEYCLKLPGPTASLLLAHAKSIAKIFLFEEQRARKLGSYIKGFIQGTANAIMLRLQG